MAGKYEITRVAAMLDQPNTHTEDRDVRVKTFPVEATILEVVEWAHTNKGSWFLSNLTIQADEAALIPAPPEKE